MFNLRSEADPVFLPTLIEGPLTLSPPTPGDHEDWVAIRQASRDHLTAWEEAWTARDLEMAAFRRRLRVWERQRRQGGGLSLFIRLTEGRVLLGGVTLSNIRYGAAQTGILGYWLGSTFTANGYGEAAVRALSRHAVETIGLNRLEAACQPENTRSQRLLEKIGFQSEGRARSYLRINGTWRDHDIYALIAGDLRERPDGTDFATKYGSETVSGLAE